MTHRLTRSVVIAALVGVPVLPDSVAADTLHQRSTYPSSIARQSYVAAAPRWRPVGVAQRMARPVQWQRVVVGARSNWPRNARPVSRARDLVAQFRPDPRYDGPQNGPQQPAFDSGVEDLNAQFRPVQPRRQLSYEQLQQQELQQQQQRQQNPRQNVVPYQVYPAMPYLAPPPPPVPYWAPYW